MQKKVHLSTEVGKGRIKKHNNKKTKGKKKQKKTHCVFLPFIFFNDDKSNSHPHFQPI